MIPITNNFLVVTLGYYGRGSTATEAAQNCHKAGSPKTYQGCLIVTNTEINFVDAMFVEYSKATTANGMTLNENGDRVYRYEIPFKKLSALLQ